MEPMIHSHKLQIENELSTLKFNYLRTSKNQKKHEASMYICERATNFTSIIVGQVHLKNPRKAVLKEYWMLVAWPFTISMFESNSSNAERTAL